MKIRTKKELQELATKLGVRSDWHEPDEQEVEAVVIGFNFDNAGSPDEEIVIIRKSRKIVGEINLATLLAIACQ